MKDKLRAYMDHLFREVPQTMQAIEIKEEILQNITDKYEDLIKEGKTEEAAYNIAIASIGDLDELLATLKTKETTPTINTEEITKAKKKSALFVSIAVTIYIVSFLPAIVLDEVGANPIVGVCIMFVLIAIATALLIYNGMTKTDYTKIDDTMVEEFKEWQNKNTSKTQTRKSIQSVAWSIITVLYFVISFATGAWYVTWVIFLMGGTIDSIIKALFEIKK